MLKNIPAAVLIVLAASSLSAQDRVQDRYHSVTAQPCFEQSDQLHDFLESNNQLLLFTGLGITEVIGNDGAEITSPALIMTYVDQDNSNFSIVGVYEDGVACLLTEGVGFEPYVD